ncbi:hypothetical protein CBOM_01378 [Ceraceosorus bombacis]|uniref:Uncharacterized protein n=1 Tax=Ceraceosorus bombacis TaxID=401625 RepID=A0A0P1BBG3_9BASI|nr:hypothetical protein CBOM_01378 [Ceraceosorus bombacis]
MPWLRASALLCGKACTFPVAVAATSVAHMALTLSSASLVIVLTAAAAIAKGSPKDNETATSAEDVDDVATPYKLSLSKDKRANDRVDE